VGYYLGLFYLLFPFSTYLLGGKRVIWEIGLILGGIILLLIGANSNIWGLDPKEIRFEKFRGTIFGYCVL